MGLFAFRRAQDREATAKAVASAPVKAKRKPSPKKTNGSNNRRDRRIGDSQ
jgi:hypothetical protein